MVGLDARSDLPRRVAAKLVHRVHPTEVVHELRDVNGHHVDGLTEPVVASRSEKAILADIEAALTEAAGIPRRRRTPKGQETLLA